MFKTSLDPYKICHHMKKKNSKNQLINPININILSAVSCLIMIKDKMIELNLKDSHQRNLLHILKPDRPNNKNERR